MNLKNISYRKYQPKDFEKIFKLFVKFQHKAKLSHYETLTKDQGPLFSMPYFVEELKKVRLKLDKDIKQAQKIIGSFKND